MGIPIGAAAGRDCSSRADAALRRDLKTLGLFIDLYCRHKHEEVDRSLTKIKTHRVDEIVGRPLRLCDQCRRLLAHAFTKRTHCPLSPKPACKHCPSHCYHPKWRGAIREVMRFSGKKLILSGRLDYIFHMLF